MHMGFSHVHHAYFMTNLFTKSILKSGNVGQTVRTSFFKWKWVKQIEQYDDD